MPRKSKSKKAQEPCEQAEGWGDEIVIDDESPAEPSDVTVSVEVSEKSTEQVIEQEPEMDMKIVCDQHREEMKRICDEHKDKLQSMQDELKELKQKMADMEAQEKVHVSSSTDGCDRESLELLDALCESVKRIAVRKGPVSRLDELSQKLKQKL